MTIMPLDFNYEDAGTEKLFESRKKCLIHNYTETMG